MQKILYLHAGAEMYGADKVLLELIKGLNKDEFEAHVILPNDGVLAGAFDLKVPDKTELRVSASMKSVRSPTLANEIAKLTDVVDFPSPASTELIAITFI